MRVLCALAIMFAACVVSAQTPTPTSTPPAPFSTNCGPYQAQPESWTTIGLSDSATRALVASPGAGRRIVVTAIHVTSTDATTVTLSGGDASVTYEFGAQGTAPPFIPPFLCLPPGEGLNVDQSGSAGVTVTVGFYKVRL